MAEPVERAQTQIADYPGLVTNAGPMTPADAPGAAVEQVNLRAHVAGELSVRPGYRRVEFDTEP